MTLSHMTKVEKIKARLGFGCKREGQVGGCEEMDRVAVKLEQDWVSMDERNSEKQVRL